LSEGWILCLVRCFCCCFLRFTVVSGAQLHAWQLHNETASLRPEGDIDEVNMGAHVPGFGGNRFAIDCH